MNSPLTLVSAALALAACLYAAELRAQHDHHHQHQPEEASAAAATLELMPTRDASGTAWQPDGSPHVGNHHMWRDWMVMHHGQAQFVYTDQGGRRGDEDGYIANMWMVRAARPLPEAVLTISGMFSLEPVTVGRHGYPLLLQSGETADGVTHLIDAQHPHDFLMELSAKYRRAMPNGDAAFAYVALAGEPAIGPPAFMHRFSGIEFPDSPIAHHWLDATHVVFGVVTLGYERGGAKAEVSAFNGREPDEHRWNVETEPLDSVAGRLSWNTGGWALQASAARLREPEQLAPGVDVTRWTASALYGADTANGHWQFTGAFGRNRLDGGPTLDAWLAEAAWRFAPGRTALVRAERTDKNELESGHAHGVAFHTVSRITAGYVHDLWTDGPRALALGATATVNFVPSLLEHEYGERPIGVSVFARLRF